LEYFISLPEVHRRGISWAVRGQAPGTANQR
jgi:hypothetical protein